MTFKFFTVEATKEGDRAGVVTWIKEYKSFKAAAAQLTKAVNRIERSGVMLARYGVETIEG